MRLGRLRSGAHLLSGGELAEHVYGQFTLISVSGSQCFPASKTYLGLQVRCAGVEMARLVLQELVQDQKLGAPSGFHCICQTSAHPQMREGYRIIVVIGL